MSQSPVKSQPDRFREAARALECDDDKERFDERLRKVAQPKPNDGTASRKKTKENSGE